MSETRAGKNSETVAIKFLDREEAIPSHSSIIIRSPLKSLLVLLLKSLCPVHISLSLSVYCKPELKK